VGFAEATQALCCIQSWLQLLPEIQMSPHAYLRTSSSALRTFSGCTKTIACHPRTWMKV
jgi:hypothetical protein